MEKQEIRNTGDRDQMQESDDGTPKAAFRGTESLYDGIFSLVPDPVAISDLETGSIVDVNEAFVLWSRFPRSELVGRTTLELGLWVNSEKRREIAEVLSLAGLVNNVEVELRRGNGEVRQVLFSGRIIETGGRRFLLSVANDITERQKAEEALRKSEEKYRSIFENTVEGIFQTTPQGRYLTVNPSMASIFGYDSPEELINTIVDIRGQQYVDPEARAKLNKLYEQQGLVEGFETQVHKKDGSRVWISMNARAVKDSNGRILYYEGTAEDITERKKAEAELAEEMDTLYSVLQNAPYGIFVNDLGGRVLIVNPEARHITGYDKEDIPTGAVLMRKAYPDPGYRKTVIRTWKEDVSRKSIDRVFSVFCKDGTIKELEFRAFRLPDGKVVTMFSDISQRKRAEEERKNLEMQLLQSQKMEAIGQLAGGIAHDFNNILTALIGYGSLLKMKIGPNDPLRIYVDQILASSEMAAGLTQSLLAFSRKQLMELQPYPLRSIIKGIEKILPRLLTEDIELKVFPSGSELAIMTDVSKIDQVLLNLATNARDAMPNGGTLTIETKPVYIDSDFARIHGFGEPGSYALISVTDTGTGMDKATRERIFDPFFTTKEVGKGTGLGLSTVYGIVKQHGGYITVYSEPGRGSAFHVYIPVAKTGVREVARLPINTRGGTETILIAEYNAP